MTVLLNVAKRVDPDKQKEVVQSFLMSLDMDMPMVDHFKNVMRDALVYKWGSEIVVDLMAGIEDAYNKQENK